VSGLPGCLTSMSEYPTLSVVKTDIPSNAPPPPRRTARTFASGPVQAAVGTRTVSQLESDLALLLRAAQPSRAFSDMAADGTPQIPSLVAVWLISQVGKTVGRPKLVNLSRVRREEMRSLGGVARLVHRTLHPVPAGAVAS
jgi:hypothetical protein